jgi:MoxR-like ATPase
VQPQQLGQQPTQSAMPTMSPQPAPAGPAPAAPVFKSGLSNEELAKTKQILDTITSSYEKRIVGQQNLRTSLLVALLTSGHVLLESVPGLAKTTAAATLASVVQGTFHRIQCTPDLLPSDIIGTQIYDYTNATFKTQLGPVHANFVLLDEINRSSAKTQSAMLEAMQERQTTIGGKLHPLPSPFLVLATQNPIEEEGTYVLPEAQMDRFLLKEIIGYPTAEEELEVMKRFEGGVLSQEALKTLQNVTLEDVKYMQDSVAKIYLDDSIKKYIVSLVAATREPGKFIPADQAKYVQFGASPRASLAFMQVSRALALLNGRGYVIPEDVKQLRYSVLRHRIILNFEAVADQVHQETIIDALFSAIQTP